jgi:hypothetical protein
MKANNFSSALVGKKSNRSLRKVEEEERLPR